MITSCISFIWGPDFVVGPDADKSKRNILGVIEKVGKDFALEVIKHRAYGQKIVEIIGGKPISPVLGIPGGVNKSVSAEELSLIRSMGESSIGFVQKTLQYFEDLVLKNRDYLALVLSRDYRLECYDMGLVDEQNRLNFYDGLLRVTDPSGKEVLKFPVSEYLEHVAEKVVPWSYVKLPYLKKIGWKGLEAGPGSGVYRVGPLARLNVSEGLTTPLAQAEFEKYQKTLGGKPVHQTLAFHWARLIELLHAAEMVVLLSSEPIPEDAVLRNPVGEPGEGIGVIEAARGVLIHHYKVGGNRLIEKANMVVATTHNKIPIGLSIKRAAEGLIHAGKVTEGALNRVEMAFRAYDPCFACASHAVSGGVAVAIKIYDHGGRLIHERPRFKQ